MEAIQSKDETLVGQLLSETRETFSVKRTTVDTLTIRKGFGVVVDLIYAGDDEPNPDEPVAFDAYTVKIEPAACTFVGGAFCVEVGPKSYYPVENFGDDEDDLSAARFFTDEADAKDHVKYVTRALTYNGLRAY